MPVLQRPERSGKALVVAVSLVVTLLVLGAGLAWYLTLDAAKSSLTKATETAQSAMATGDFKKAKRVLERAIDDFPDRPDRKDLLVQPLKLLDEATKKLAVKRAQEAQAGAKQGHEQSAQIALSNIKALVTQRDLELARRMTAKAMEEYIGTSSANEFSDLLREIDREIGQVRQSQSRSEAQRQAAHERHLSYRSEGTAAFNRKDYKAAIEAFGKALREEEDSDTQRLLEDAIDKTRNPRIAVVEFKVAGDVGVPDLGRSVAEMLLTKFDPQRFQLVERMQLKALLHEQDLAIAGIVDNPKLAKSFSAKAVRYLVVGTVARMGNLVISARLVDVMTGDVVQTADAAADDALGLQERLEEVARILQMSPEEKRAYLENKRQELLARARQAKQERDYDDARAIYEQIQVIAPSPEIESELVDIKAARKRGVEQTAGPQESGNFGLQNRSTPAGTEANGKYKPDITGRDSITRAILSQLNSALLMYQLDMDDYPPEGDLCQSLTGYRADDGTEGFGFRRVRLGKVYGPYNGAENLRVQPSANGTRSFLDGYGNPIRYQRPSEKGGRPVLISAGPNALFGDDDDIRSDDPMLEVPVSSSHPGGSKTNDHSASSDASPGKELVLDLGGNVSLTLVLIPSGKFMMGSPDGEKDRSADEGPQREVTISKPFYMGVTAVTQEQYEPVMGKNRSNFKGATNPVENVSWDDAVEFCKKLSTKTGKTVRLPTEAQWEYACRAGSKTRFGFGDDEDKLADYAWYSKNSDSKTHPVGQKKPNDFGLYDMHGNVWQWCADWHDEKYYANADKTDPAGPASGSCRVLRGGSWGINPQFCRSALRYWSGPGGRLGDYGFRVVAVGAARVD